MINFPETIPSQGERHFWHITGACVIGAVGFWAKPNLERFFRNENAEDQIRDRCNSKMIAYFMTGILGAVIGGVVKGLRTRTCNGTMAGVVTGAIVSLIGARLSECCSDSNASSTLSLDQ